MTQAVNTHLPYDRHLIATSLLDGSHVRSLIDLHTSGVGTHRCCLTPILPASLAVRECLAAAFAFVCSLYRVLAMSESG